MRGGTVSIAKVALAYGINPNQLHNWIALYRKEGVGRLPTALRESSAFIPVVTSPIPAEFEPQEMRPDITLGNGIRVDLSGLSRDDVCALSPVLAGLRCSASTRR